MLEPLTECLFEHFHVFLLQFSKICLYLPLDCQVFGDSSSYVNFLHTFSYDRYLIFIRNKPSISQAALIQLHMKQKISFLIHFSFPTWAHIQHYFLPYLISFIIFWFLNRALVF